MIIDEDDDDDDDDGQMIFGDLGNLKLPDICLTGEEKPRKNLTQETCPDRGSNPGPLHDRRACCRLANSGGHETHKQTTTALGLLCTVLEMGRVLCGMQEVERRKSTHPSFVDFGHHCSVDLLYMFFGPFNRPRRLIKGWQLCPLHSVCVYVRYTFMHC